jgi:tetratricopeptide (TPR) repeat protein
MSSQVKHHEELDSLYERLKIRTKEEKHNIHNAYQLILLNKNNRLKNEDAIKELQTIYLFFAAIDNNTAHAVCGWILYNIAKIFAKDKNYEKLKNLYDNAIKFFLMCENINEDILTNCLFEYVHLLIRIKSYDEAYNIIKKFAKTRNDWTPENQCRYGVFIGRLYELMKVSKDTLVSSQ